MRRRLLLNGVQPPCSRDMPGVPRPRGLSHGCGRGWGAMGVLGRLQTRGYHHEDAVKGEKLGQGGFIHVVRVSLALRMLFG